jgi:hypothetical protein
MFLRIVGFYLRVCTASQPRTTSWPVLVNTSEMTNFVATIKSHRIHTLRSYLDSVETPAATAGKYTVTTPSLRPSASQCTALQLLQR